MKHRFGWIMLWAVFGTINLAGWIAGLKFQLAAVFFDRLSPWKVSVRVARLGGWLAFATGRTRPTIASGSTDVASTHKLSNSV